MNLSVQFFTILSMTAMGIWIGLSMDTYRRFFYRGPRRRWSMIQIAGDLLFWIIQGLLAFFVLLEVNQGRVRITVFLALLCGYAAYQSLFRTLYVRGLDLLLASIAFSFRFLGRLFSHLFVRPVGFLLKGLWFSCKIIIKAVLSVLLFVGASIGFVFKRLFFFILPTAFLESLKKNAGVPQFVKNIKNIIKKWFH